MDGFSFPNIFNPKSCHSQLELRLRWPVTVIHNSQTKFLISVVLFNRAVIFDVSDLRILIFS